MVAWSKNLNRLPFLRTGLSLGLERWGNSLKMQRFGEFLKQPPSFASAYNTFRGIFSHQEACLIINQLSISIPILPPLVPPYQGGGLGWGSTPEDEVSFLELSGYMRNQLLRDSDIMSMNWGLELRVPFVDKTLLETVAPIPSNIRLAQGKKLLTQAITEIPDWVINRPKKGFSFPFESWMNSEFGDYFHNVHQKLNIPPNIPLKPWYRRWSLAILNHWWEQINS